MYQGVRPWGYNEALNPAQIAAMLKVYGPKALRVDSYGYVDDVPIGLLWVDPSYPWLEDHFAGNTAVRLVEFAEIGAQAALILCLYERIVTQVRQVAFCGSGADLIETNPKLQRAIRPGDTIRIDLGRGERKMWIDPDPDLNGRYIRISGACNLSIDGVSFARTYGHAWVMARPGDNFPTPKPSEQLPLIVE
jgi:hypothetical protein